MKIVLFCANHLSYRGTEIALFDYAYYNEKILNNKSIIAVDKNSKIPFNNDVVKKFSIFPIHYYTTLQDLQILCEKEKIDVVYSIKYGTKEDVVPGVKNVVHCVFKMSKEDEHSNIYAGVSESVATIKGVLTYPVVPHIVTLPPPSGNLRKVLNIKDTDLVFSRLGGNDMFASDMVKKVILDIVNKYDNIYFLFSIRPRIFTNIEHKQLKFFSPIVDPILKRKFIDTSDAMLHYSSLGESFGIAILEYCFCNKPVILMPPQPTHWHNAHLKNLQNKGIFYNNECELSDVLINFKDIKKEEDYTHLVSPFAPEKVMSQFEKIFLH